MHKQMRIYQPVSWLVSINTYQWKSCLLLTWLQSSWKLWSICSRWKWTGNLILGGSESLLGLK